MAKAPAPGTVKARREVPEIGVTVLTLSNGVEVWLKPTDFRADQVVFSSYARGGVSTASPAQYFNASLSSSLVGIAGVGGLSPVDLGKLLAGKIGGASAYVSTYTHGVTGSATPRDLETALQLAYLHFTAPNRDPGAFDLMRRRLEASLANQAESPGAVFGERLRRLNTVDHYTSRPLRMEDLATLDAEAMWKFYAERLRQRRQLHVLLRRQLHGGRDHAAPGHLSRIAAVEGHARRAAGRRAPAVPGDRAA